MDRSNLYLIRRDAEADYEEPQAFVVAAPSPKVARQLIRDHVADTWSSIKLADECASSSQTSLKRLGVALVTMKPQVLLVDARGA